MAAGKGQAAGNAQAGPDWPPDPAAAKQYGLCPVIVGATAVGKTGLILSLAAEFPIEVISLDSRQIYHGLRIGTAQPTVAEQASCRHHLVDFLPPAETYSAQRFREDFCSLWRAITARRQLPLLVGGAGLYLRAVSEGFFKLPPDHASRLPRVRESVAALSDADLAAALRNVDPATAARLHPNDRYRRQRALEIYHLSGRPASELAASQQPQPALGLEFAVVYLTRPTAVLNRRIAARTAAMLAGRWIDETRALLRAHAPDCPGLRSLGYAEIVRFLQGGLPASELPDAIVHKTRQYAKRQRTWFDKVPASLTGEPEDPALRQDLRRLLAEAWQRVHGS